METFEIIATTLFGLEEVLAAELSAIGAQNIEVLNRAVKYTGDNELLYKSNLLLRTAVKILKPIKTFYANNEHKLYDGIKRINWDDYFSYKNTFAIDGSSHGALFTHSKYVALKSKDAIADQFRDKFHIRPSVDTENPDIRINVHIKEDFVIVSLDSSGSSLGKRNYRLMQNEAPISEVLAAGIILLSGWDKNSDFIDPMCGSGTFSIEAAMIACNIPAGKNRKFGFTTWRDFNKDLWSNVIADAEKNITSFSKKIIASDIDAGTLEIAKSNAHRAGVAEFINFNNADFFQSEYSSGKAHIIINPPYGERLLVDEISAFYSNMGTRLKHFYHGCDAWVISSNYEAFKNFGLRTSRKIKLFNGPLECRLQKYELYMGSKKTAKEM